MRTVLLGFAASLAATLPAAASAEAQAQQASVGPSPASIDGGFGIGRDHRDGRRHHRHFRHRHFSGFNGFNGFIAYDRDYQGDTAWRSNGFNDWWHNRPDRSYPRWVQDNQSCERMWWSGSGWRC